MPTLRNRSAAQVPGGVFDYTISQEFWKGKDGDGVDYQVAKRYGDFRETKGYIITGKAPVNGIVIQYINKRAKVELAKPVKIGGVLKNIVETSADIEALTKKSVKYMCDSYFEGFYPPTIIEKKEEFKKTKNARSRIKLSIATFVRSVQGKSRQSPSTRSSGRGCRFGTRASK